MTKTTAIIRSYVGVLVFAVPIFLGAGTLAFWQGLLYVGVALVITGVAAAVASRSHRRWARIAFAAIFCAVVIGCAATAGANIVAVGRFIPGPAGPG